MRSQISLVYLLLMANASGATAQQIVLPNGTERLSPELMASFKSALRDGEFPISEAGATKRIPLGRGYNTLAGEFRGDCISGVSKQESSQGFSADYSLTQVRSSEEFRHTLQLSASASMGVGIWKGDLSSSFFQSLDRNRFYDYLVVKVIVSGPTLSINKEAISNEARPLLSDPGRFYTRCGNQYIKSVTFGGEFSAVITIETSNESQRQELRAAMSVAAAGYGSAKASFAESLSKVTKNYKRSVKILRNGTNESIPDLEIDTIIKYSLDFPTKINMDTAYPYSLDKAYYSEVNVNLPRYEKEQVIADAWATRAGDIYADYADMNYYKDNREKLNFYPPLSESQLSEGMQKLTSVVTDLKIQYIDCLERPIPKCGQMKFPGFDAALPKRAQRAAIDAKQGASQLIGVIGGGESKTVAILGDWSAWSEGENLWWPPERCCFNIVIAPANGPIREEPYAGPKIVQGPARISVRIGDSHYSDNRSKDLVGIIY